VESRVIDDFNSNKLYKQLLCSKNMAIILTGNPEKYALDNSLRVIKNTSELNFEGEEYRRRLEDVIAINYPRETNLGKRVYMWEVRKWELSPREKIRNHSDLEKIRYLNIRNRDLLIKADDFLRSDFTLSGSDGDLLKEFNRSDRRFLETFVKEDGNVLCFRGSENASHISQFWLISDVVSRVIIRYANLGYEVIEH